MLTPVTTLGILSLTALIGAAVLLLRRLGAGEVALAIIALCVVAVVSAFAGILFG